MNARFQVVSLPRPGFTSYNVVDTLPGQLRILCTTLICADAETIAAALNGPRNQTNPRLRPLAAMEIADFRMFLEHENGGPLTDCPSLALFLDDLCNFLRFNTGEKSIALGESLLVYLCFLDTVPTDSIEIVETDSTIQVSA